MPTLPLQVDKTTAPGLAVGPHGLSAIAWRRGQPAA